jgi:hypothetical protein
MTADIWLTPAVSRVLDELERSAPAHARAVNAAIRDIGVKQGVRLNIPTEPPAEPFLAVRPTLRDAPVVIYRRTTPEEQGDWLVVSLMKPDDYRAARHAEEVVANAAPAVRKLVNAVVAGTVATVKVTAPPGTVTISPTDEAAPTTSTDTPHPAGL